MRTKYPVSTLLLLVLVGCKNDTRIGSRETDSTSSREQMIEVATEALRSVGLYHEGGMMVYFDAGNRRWHSVLDELDREMPDEAEVYHEKLDKQSYQAIHFSHDPPAIDGTYWVFVDTKTKKVIMYGAGL